MTEIEKITGLLISYRWVDRNFVVSKEGQKLIKRINRLFPYAFVSISMGVDPCDIIKDFTGQMTCKNKKNIKRLLTRFVRSAKLYK